MATLKSTLTLYDNMSRQLDKIANSLQKTTSMMGGLDSAMSRIKSPDIDTSKTTNKLNKLSKDVQTPFENVKVPSINIDASKATGQLNAVGKNLDGLQTKVGSMKLEPKVSVDSSLSKIKLPDVDTSQATTKLNKLSKDAQSSLSNIKTPTINVNNEKALQNIKLIENALSEAQKKFDAVKLDPKVSADSVLAAGNKVSRYEKQLESAKTSMYGVQPAAASASSSIASVGEKAEKTGSIFKSVMGASVVATGISKGMSLISNSVGGAVARFDTLNQYPKVMQQMGYSSKDAGQAVKVMKAGVDGLPTSLQELTKSAQSFAILQNSATGGAKTATALNDAFLASGASAADASRGVQQYSQMLASGKVDSQSWRTLTETMPYALTKVAKSFGITGDAAKQDLYDKLQSGEITMKQLNDRFVELDGGATGFAKTARVASQGIGTSMQNLKNSITSGIASSITALDNGIKKAGKGGIAQILDSGKGAINKFFETFNGFIEKAIPKIISFLKAAMPILKFFGSWVVAAGPIGGVMLAASGGMLVFNKALGGMKTAMSAVAAHPFIALIFGIGTALVWAYQNLDWFKKAIDSTFKFLEKHSDIVGNTLPIALFGIVPMAILAASKISKLKSSFGGLFNKLTKSSKALEDSKKASESAAKGAESLKKGLNGLMKLGGIAMVVASLALLAVAIQPLAKTGFKGAAAMLAFGAAVGIMAVSIGMMGGRLNSGLPGIIAFAGAVSVMALAMVPLANTGNKGIVSMLAFAGSVSIMAVALGLMGSQLQQNMAGILVFSVAVGIMALAMAPLATTGMQGAIAMGAFAVSVSVMAVALGLMGPMLQTSMAGIIVFAAAVSVMALAMAPLAATGTQGAIAMAAFGVVIAGLAIVFAIFGPALTAASVGMLVFGVMAMMVGAAVMMVGTGIMIAMVGVSMLGTVLPIVATYGMQAAVALLAFGASLILFSAGALLGGVAAISLSAGLLLLSAGLFAVGAGALVAGAGFVVLGAGLVVVGAGLMAVSAGIMALYTTVVTIFSNIVGAISGAMSNALSAVSNGISNMVSAVQNVGGSLVDAGKNFVMGFVNGIKNAIGSAVDAAANMAKSAVGAAKKFLNIHSPSRVMRDQVGRFFAEGMAVGIDNNASGVSDASANMASSAVDAASGLAIPDISAPNVGLPSNPGDLLTDGFNNALNSLKELIGLMGKTDGTNISVNSNGNFNDGLGTAQKNANGIASTVGNIGSGIGLQGLSASQLGNFAEPGKLLADGFNNAMQSLQSLFGLMSKIDGANIGVTNNGGQSDSGFNPAGLMVSGGSQSTNNSDNSQTITVESGAIQIVTNGSDVDGETIARKLEEFLKHRADANLNHA